eukprot:11155439-Lingulodinium_polyedra.AAC.1
MAVCRLARRSPPTYGARGSSGRRVARQDPGPQCGPEVGVFPLCGVRPIPHAQDAVADILAV